MNKQCGNCKWWDEKNKVLHTASQYASDCDAPVPASMGTNVKYWMIDSEGKNCPVYEERKE